RDTGAAPDGPDTSIVNPRHLPALLREAVCEQCHLTTKYRVVRRGRGEFDYRPGLPLPEYWSVFVTAADPAGVGPTATRPEQMRASRCSRASGRLGCTSCHDPHAAPAPERKPAHYRERCLACHGEGDCRLPAAQRRRQHPDDACTACHMPRTRGAR